MNSGKVQYLNYLSSEEWRRVKETVLSVHGKKCEKCGETSNLQVHHKSYQGDFYTVSLYFDIFKDRPGCEERGWGPNSDNFLVLCKKCHTEIHDEWGTIFHKGGCPTGEYYLNNMYDFATGRCGTCGLQYDCSYNHFQGLGYLKDPKCEPFTAAVMKAIMSQE